MSTKLTRDSRVSGACEIDAESVDLDFGRIAPDMATLAEMNTRWERASNAGYEFPGELNAQETEAYLMLARSGAHLSLGQVILGELAEAEPLDERFVREIYAIGDIAARCAVVLRKDVPFDIIETAIASASADVVMHALFNPAVTEAVCEGVKARWGASCVGDAAQRAIEYKRGRKGAKD